MSSSAARAAVLERAIEACVRGDSSVISELYTDDVQGWTPTLTVSSAAQLAVEFEDREEAFSDVEVELMPLGVTGDKACVEWVARATHSGPLLVDDETVVEPTGRRFTLRGVTIAEFDNAHICAFRQYWDEAELLDGLGLLPSD